ncbi:FG-GAP-like repeat-containing protein [Akkermansiaceae bacterium]|nr:FG-GAP-like repeat-containing protein [Akkermansiaceae bacterium]
MKKSFHSQKACLPPLFTGGIVVGLLASGVLADDSVVVPSDLNNSPGSITQTPLPQRTATKRSMFRSMSVEETGIDFVNPIDTSHPMKRLYHSGFVCGGVAVGDLNGDGKADLFLNSGPRPNRLYLQDDALKFRDATAASGLAESVDTWSTGVTMVDVNADGHLDLFICNYDAPNQLFLNRGDGTFSKPDNTGLDIVDASLTASFADYDNDGDLDCYLLTNRYYRANGRPVDVPAKMENGVAVVLDEYKKYYRIKHEQGKHFSIEEYGREDRLFRNNGDGTFDEVTAASKITGHGHGLSMMWWDYDDDGWMDIYVCNDYDDPDRLWRNNGDGTFTNVIANAMPHTSWFAMGSDLADVNNDGRMDFFSVDMSATNHFRQKTTMGAMNNAKILAVAGPPQQIMRNALLLNTGTGRFQEAAFLAGIADSDWSWAPKFGDYDCDGQTDLFISNGMARNFTDSDIKFTNDKKVGQTVWDFYEDTAPKPDRNLVFQNRGDLKFEDKSKEWGLDHFGMSYSAASGDLDGDGDLELVVANLDEPVKVFRNEGSDGHQAVVRLVGNGGNRWGIGASIRATIATESGELTLVRLMNPYTGFLSSNQPEVHFGLGEATSILRLEIKWPNGRIQNLENLPADHRFVIRESEHQALVSKPLENTGESKSYFDVHAAHSATHQETYFDDFALQPLLPNQLSQLGPGMAVTDLNKDGLSEVYLGGGAGFPGKIYSADTKGRLRAIAMFEEEAAYEDMGCLFFDVEGDGDLDLYVVSGGVECGDKTELLADRLYINQEGKQFKLSEGVLPKLQDSGGCVAAADFDRDGDLDLFVGGRVVPGEYPTTPMSRLLVNESDEAPKFIDGTETHAKEVAQCGMVTSALWTDVDADGWIDLMVTTEWGPVRLFLNHEGKLSEATESAGLDAQSGWFNGIAGRDIDNDGDIDYVVTNFGLNTKYHASHDHPSLLYYGDFEGNGKKRLIEAEEEGETLFPVRGKSCSTAAMPSLGKKFGTYKAFALASLEEIYTPESLKSADRFAVDTLESGVLINDGRGHFKFQALPRIAQISPGFGVQLMEVDGDGNADVIIAQNFFSPQLETGNCDGGLSLLLLGNGDGSFRAASPDRSGIVIPGDAKAVSQLDFNGDGRADFLISTNSGATQVLNGTQGDGPKTMAIRLAGPKGNADGIGSRVTMTCSDGSIQAAEVSIGGSYLSQSAPDLFFALSEDRLPAKIEVVWADGKTTSHEIVERAARIKIGETK